MDVSAIARALCLFVVCLVAATPIRAEEKIEAATGKPSDDLPAIETPVTSTPRPFNAHDPIAGRRSRRAGGHLGTVGAARFYAEHQMIILNVNHALQLYWAETGTYPTSNDEFMEKVIKANGIPLPKLEPQHEYIYVPEQPEVGLQIRLKPMEESAAALTVQPSPSAVSLDGFDSPCPCQVTKQKHNRHRLLLRRCRAVFN